MKGKEKNIIKGTIKEREKSEECWRWKSIIKWMERGRREGREGMEEGRKSKRS